jgi:hypothetical protein
MLCGQRSGCQTRGPWATAALKKLFVSYHSGSADEVAHLASALRIRGIAPWVDRVGGFSVADECEAEVRRAIREDCFGLVLYATETAFTRPFIRDVEMDEAAKVRGCNRRYLLFAIARGLDFSEVQRRSRADFGVDLARYHGIEIPASDDVRNACERAANSVLEIVLRRSARAARKRGLHLQFSTVECMPDDPEDVLCINATTELAAGGAQEDWARLLRGLMDAERLIARTCGRPRLHVHGSKSLPAAFVFGRVFSRYLLSTVQRPSEVWRSDAGPARRQLLAEPCLVPARGTRELTIEIRLGRRNVSAGVDDLIATGQVQPSLRMRLSPAGGPQPLDEHSCRAMVDQTRDTIEKVLRDHPAAVVHLFAAMPQSFMMMLGQTFTAMPPVRLYDWDGGCYVHRCTIPGGRL